MAWSSHNAREGKTALDASSPAKPALNRRIAARFRNQMGNSETPGKQ